MTAPVHGTREDALTALRDEIVARMRAANLLKPVMDYWALRAELVSRSRTETLSYAAEKMADGQISICYETADTIRQALEADEGNASPEAADRTPAQRMSAV